VGASAVLLAVPLGRIWDTPAELVDVGIVAVAALLSTLVATLLEKRQHQAE
jgi:hypothetical protein